MSNATPSTRLLHDESGLETDGLANGIHSPEVGSMAHRAHVNCRAVGYYCFGMVAAV
jgi:hypothetical protein